MRWLVLLAAPILGCGYGGALASGRDGGPGDAGDPRADAGPGAADAGGPDAGFPVAPHDPYPTVPYQGGPVFTQMDVVTITYSDNPIRDQLEAFGDWMMDSGYLPEVAGEYGIGGGTHRAVRLDQAEPTGASSSDILGTIDGWVHSGVLPPSSPAKPEIYLVYLVRTSLSDDTLCPNDPAWGFHTSPFIGANNQDGGYASALVIGCPGYRGGGGFAAGVTLGPLEIAASHEMMEAATDPYGTGYGSFDPDNPWMGELGDLCAYRAVALDGGTPQRLWSNRAARAGTNPCVPVPEGEIDFNVSPQPSGLLVADAGETLEVELTAWSEAPLGPWQIGAYPSGDFTMATSLTRSMVKNGDVAELTLGVPATALSGAHGYAAISSFTSTGAYRYWPIEVRIR